MRDISSTDITQGVKKTNLRQEVEEQAEKLAKSKNIEITEIRHREIALGKTDISSFKMKDLVYKTNTTTVEQSDSQEESQPLQYAFDNLNDIESKLIDDNSTNDEYTNDNQFEIIDTTKNPAPPVTKAFFFMF